MRLVTYQRPGEARLGASVGDRVVDLAGLAQAKGQSLPSDMLAFIDAGPEAWERAKKLLEAGGQWPSGVSFPTGEVKLLAPIPRPRKNVICLGLNYAEHVAEGSRAMNVQRDLPKEPIYFTKPPTSVTGPDAPVYHDERVSTKMDWEAELAVVMGRGGKRIPRERALEYIFGYTCYNDVSARDLQRARGGQWHLGKSLDTYGPMGPWIVTADELTDPANLNIMCRVNGVTKQNSNTRFLIFDIPTCIADYSAGVTLEAGDVISTGTPDGVGFARNPPEFMQPGDTVEVEIEQIGILKNPIVQAPR
jgi:2-keto-4-pentenoate hydratase/2-oxohepta-3-ene-1,7-dioic acid hydratase in catechol pathway